MTTCHALTRIVIDELSRGDKFPASLDMARAFWSTGLSKIRFQETLALVRASRSPRLRMSRSIGE